MISQAERAAEQRRIKLELVRQQVQEGSLTIRKMTPEERKLYPPRQPKAQERGRRIRERRR